MVYTVSGVNYTRRAKIPVAGAASGAQTDFQIMLVASWSSAMQDDFDDIRFTEADMETLIDAWLESKVNSTTANIWVEFPTTPADGVEKTEACMYYGNTGAASGWDGAATFIDFISHAPGNLTEWDATGGTVAATTDHPHTGTYGGKLTGAGTSPHLQRNVSAKNTIYEIWIYDDGITTTNFQNTIRLYDSVNHDPLAGLWMGTSTTHYIYRAEGGSYTASSVARSNGWHKIKFVVRDSDTLVYIDDTLLFTENGLDENNLSHIRCYGYSAGVGYVDDYIERKYAANPPTAAFGTEEHQRRTPMMM